MKSLHRTVFILGLVSFFTDVSSEMIYALMPVFLSTQLMATPIAIGFIEGLAELIASWTKLYSGKLSDRSHKKKNILFIGYSISALMRPLVGIATSWPEVLLFRSSDRIGKGIRTSPRDAMIAEVTPENRRGLAFGFHRAMDHWGAVTGPLVATVLIYVFSLSIRHVFLLALVPGLISVFIIFFGLQEKNLSDSGGASTPTAKKTFSFDFKADWRKSPLALKLFLTSIFVFTLGQASEAFLLLKIGQSLEIFYLPLIWSALNFVKATSSHYVSTISDRMGYKKSILIGWIYYGVCLYFIGVATDLKLQILFFILFGVFSGLTEAPEKALLSKLEVDQKKGTAFGYYHFLIGAGALPASVIFGTIWQKYSATSAFLFSMALSGIAFVILFFCKTSE